MSLKTIQQLKDAGFFGTMDAQIAGLVARMCPDHGNKGDLVAAAALASRAISQGHACASLSQFAGKTWQGILNEHLPATPDNDDMDDQDAPETEQNLAHLGALPELETWKDRLVAPIVGNGGEKERKRTLLVLDGDRIYLRRYWVYERKVEEKLKSLNTESGIKADTEQLNRYFPGNEAEEQKEAARKAVENRLSLLSGGPGTGKTTTLAKAVALLAETFTGQGKTLKVCMVAPTGKAAARMGDSVKEAKNFLRDKIGEALLKAIPDEASTIHRLLEARRNSPYFKHNADNPLTADMVIVDEASMVDLPLMAKLLDALPKDCSLMLVGDIDQLASVEPGRVYGDVCHAALANGPLQGSLTRLKKSWRFPDASVIGRISHLINEGRADEAWQALRENADSHLQTLDSNELSSNPSFANLVKESMRAFLKEKEPEKVLVLANNFRILCALRKGPYGVKRMNRRVEKILAEIGLKPSGRFYDHQIVMITVNTPSLKLFNGDVGVVLAEEEGSEKKRLYAWFADKENGVRKAPVNLLPDHETAFAMTVHKSQGSEFPDVAMILPDTGESPVLTRELLYTGLTRVKIDGENGKLSLWCTEQCFKAAVRKKTARATGLFSNG